MSPVINRINSLTTETTSIDLLVKQHLEKGTEKGTREECADTWVVSVQAEPGILLLPVSQKKKNFKFLTLNSLLNFVQTHTGNRNLSKMEQRFNKCTISDEQASEQEKK